GRAAEINALLSDNASRAAQTRAESEENARRADGAAQGLTALVARENAASDALTTHTAALAALSSRAEDLKKRAEAARQQLQEAEARDAELKASLREAEKAAGDARERARELENVINGHRMLLQSREQAVKELAEEQNRLGMEQRGAEARAKLLSDMEREFEGLGKAVRTVMTAASRGTLRGVYGPVAKLISVPDRYTVAIETALGGALQHIVVENQDCGRAAIELLKRGDAGRATFLPLDTIRPGTLQNPPEGAQGYLGVASALVRCDGRYRSVVENLLGRTVVAEGLPEAIAMSRGSGNRLRIVTLDGQMINAGGSMTGGSAARNVGILSRANELKQLRERLETLETRRRETAGRLAEAERVLAGAKYDSEAAAGELAGATEEQRRREAERDRFRLLRDTLDKSMEGMEREQASLASELRKNEAETAETETRRDKARRSLDALREEIAAETRGREDFEKRRRELNDALAALREEAAALESERDAALRGAADIEALLDSLGSDSAQRERSIAELEARQAEQERSLAEQRSQAEGYRAVAAEHKADIARLREEKLELEGQRTRSDREAQERNREILDLQNVCARYEQKKQGAEMEEKQLLEKLRDSYELGRSEAQRQRRPLDDPAAAAKRVTELRREISRLGSVNLGAIDEYARVKERWDFLTGQRDDIESARRDLVKIISELTGEMKEIFLREFQAIAESFREVFLELFGGGKAALELEDPEDPLACGIEIRVQPPGKAVTSISLLSGGEKSFIAICLYFAIIRVRPTPFCIMDEIDAALDEANVERYAHYMRTLTASTQFITITHHRATMEEADVLYGVTMQEKGVSTVLSIDLAEAEKTLG
ncbi:MAG: chromosome segregation protein SMC, partial [Oscillospiraceae bacterium]|nr:chromosome segregation protein SMC [Oscillospiraceae bacterium]